MLVANTTCSVINELYQFPPVLTEIVFDYLRPKELKDLAIIAHLKMSDLKLKTNFCAFYALKRIRSQTETLVQFVSVFKNYISIINKDEPSVEAQICDMLSKQLTYFADKAPSLSDVEELANLESEFATNVYNFMETTYDNSKIQKPMSEFLTEIEESFKKECSNKNIDFFNTLFASLHLYQAIKQGVTDQDVPRQLVLSKGADIGLKIHKETFVMHAFDNEGDKSLVKTLVELNADISNINFGKETSKKIRQSLSVILFKKGKEHFPYIKDAKKLIEARGDVNVPDKKGRTLLNYTVTKHASLEIFQLLMDSMANCNISDREGNTPLMNVIKRDNSNERFKESSLQVVSHLIQNRANLNLMNHEGNTAILIAAQKNSHEVVKILLEAGADVNLFNNQGEDFKSLYQGQDERSVEVDKSSKKRKDPPK